MDIPWNYHAQDIWVSMEFSYHFAHVKFPWFVHHGYSMENWETNPWCANHGNFMWAKLYENSIAIPWKPMGCDHAQDIWVSMEFSYHFAHVKIPWFVHHGYSMENWETNPWCADHGNFIWAKLYENSMETHGLRP